MRRAGSLLAVVGPGLLVAATGVGAGDLATAGFAGAELGAAVVWAVVLGAAFKFVLTEGLARWQLATGETVLEGALTRLGVVSWVVFGAYLVLWSFFVARALAMACGVTAQAIAPIGGGHGVAVWALVHSLGALIVLRMSSFRVFERVMAVGVGLMFVTVVASAVAVGPAWGEVLRGLVAPSVPKVHDGGLAWTVGLIGGVGGTLTIICYGYWIREQGRGSRGDLGTCRVDLGVGYAATALFGAAVLVIATRVEVTGSGSGLVVALGDRLGSEVGAWARWVFLVGAWAAVASSLLGVWQAVPYVFADFVRIVGGRRTAAVDRGSRWYRWSRVALALMPVPGLLGVGWLEAGFAGAQRVYAVVGACFLPALGVALLVLNGRRDWVGASMRNGWLSAGALVLIVVFFAWAGLVRLVGV